MRPPPTPALTKSKTHNEDDDDHIHQNALTSIYWRWRYFSTYSSCFFSSTPSYCSRIDLMASSIRFSCCYRVVVSRDGDRRVSPHHATIQPHPNSHAPRFNTQPNPPTHKERRICNHYNIPISSSRTAISLSYFCFIFLFLARRLHPESQYPPRKPRHVAR